MEAGPLEIAEIFGPHELRTRQSKFALVHAVGDDGHRRHGSIPAFTPHLPIDESVHVLLPQVLEVKLLLCCASKRMTRQRANQRAVAHARATFVMLGDRSKAHARILTQPDLGPIEMSGDASKMFNIKQRHL